MPEIVEFLSRSDLFSGLEPDLLQTIAASMRQTRFDAGQQIFARLDPAHGLYVLLEGRVRLSVVTAEGKELSFRVLGPGETLGEIAALDGGVRSADATALSSVTAMTLTKAALEALINDHNALARAAIRFVCARLRSTSEQLEAIALYPIESRIAQFLVTAIKLQGLRLDQREVSLPFNLTQAELAMLIGATRPRVTDALAALEAAAVFRREKSVLICSVQALQAAAGGTDPS